MMLSNGEGTGNSVLSNSIFQNGGLGIDLLGGTEDAEGVTANDNDDLDTGSNNLQNFPVIEEATRTSTSNFITMNGTLNSNPSQSYTVQCFLTGGTDPSGHGEGQSFRAEDTTVTTDANGDASFQCSFLFLGSLQGQTVSATATNTATGDTSEFSASVPVTTP
jgi:hypothetical protein